MKAFNVLSLFVALIFVASCSAPTPESETKRWESSKTTIEKLGVKYPNFKNVLNQVVTEAEPQWEAALAVSNPEEQVNAMRSANDLLNPPFVRGLENIVDDIEDLKDLTSTAAQTEGANEADMLAIKNAINEANITLTTVERRLGGTNVTSVTEANVLLDDADKNITTAKERIDKVVSNIKKRVAGEKAEERAEEKAAEAKAEEEKKAEEPIECGHCGSMNEPGSLKCSGCSAPLSN